MKFVICELGEVHSQLEVSVSVNKLHGIIWLVDCSTYFWLFYSVLTQLLSSSIDTRSTLYITLLFVVFDAEKTFGNFLNGNIETLFYATNSVSIRWKTSMMFSFLPNRFVRSRIQENAAAQPIMTYFHILSFYKIIEWNEKMLNIF